MCAEIPRGTLAADVRLIVSSLDRRPGVLLPYRVDDTYVPTAAKGGGDRLLQSNLVVRFRGFLSAKRVCSITMRNGIVVNTYGE